MNLPFPPPWWRFSRWQRDLWNATLDPVRPSKVWINAGRGAGKDIIAIRMALRDAFASYQRKKRARGAEVLNPLVKGWIVAPSEKALTQTKADFHGELLDLEKRWGLPRGKLFRHHKRGGFWSIFGPGEIEFHYLLTSREDALRGPGVDVCLYTEFASETREAAYTVELNGTLNRAGRDGRAYLYSTPKGETGLFWREVKRVCGSEERLRKVEDGSVLSEDGNELYVHATAFANGFLTTVQRERIEAERATGSVFEQERLAKFVVLTASAGEVYPRHEVEKCFVRVAPPRSRNVVVGVDLGFEGADDTVFASVDFESGFLFDIEFHAKMSGPAKVERIRQLRDEHGFSTEFIMDATSQQSMLGDWVPVHVRLTPLKVYDREKERLVLNARHLMQIGRVKIPDPDRFEFRDERQQAAFRKLVKQLLQFQRTVSRLGVVKYGHPAGEHDDGAVAWYMALDPIARSLKGDEVKPDGFLDFRKLMGM